MANLKSILINLLNQKTINKLVYYSGRRYEKHFIQFKNKKKIIYMLTPTHGNIGDQAIAVSTLQYLRNKFNEFEIIEICRGDTYKYMKAIKNIISYDDIIILHGGGNMGNLYIGEEVDRREIIKNFPNNKIVSMTQTISFTEDTKGKKELIKTSKIYNKHNDLTLIAREKKSFQIMKSIFNFKNIILNPDIVLYLNNKIDTNKYSRNMIMTCLRSDKESILGNDKESFINELENNYNNVYKYDTVVEKTIFKDERENEVNNMLDMFLKSKIVITDRLHGMVFATITKTPCIITKSLDHKVTGTYEWINELNYIRLVDTLEFDKIKEIIDELLELKEYSRINLDKKYFDSLRERVLSNEEEK